LRATRQMEKSPITTESVGPWDIARLWQFGSR